MELIQIIKQLDNEFAINKVEGNSQFILTAYPKNRDGSANLDTGIKLETLNNFQHYIVYEVQRDKEFELGKFTNKEMGYLAFYIVIKGKFEKIKGDDLVKNELRKIEKDLIQGDTILQNNVHKKYFSLDQERKGRINLLEENKKYNIYYLTNLGEKINLSKGRPLSSALVVIYNYSLALEKLDVLVKPLIKDLDLSLNEEEGLKRIYIGK